VTKLTLEQIKRKLRRYKPATPQEVLRKCQFPLQFQDEGSFRVVYRILGTQWVLKMPIQEWEEWRWKGPRSKWLRKHINHAKYEINALNIILTTTRPQLKALKSYLPEVPWAHWDTGVILMRHYRTPTLSEFARLSKTLLACIEQVQKRNTDINLYNCGVDSDGKLKVIDLGCLELTRNS
jgi:hypothetical protein